VTMLSSRPMHTRPEQLVCILQDLLPTYRVPLFEELARRLSELEQTLAVVFPEPSPFGSNASTFRDLSWAFPVPYQRFGVSDIRLLRVDGMNRFKNARLLVLPEAVSNLSSLGLLAQRRIASRGRPSLRTLVWGLGGDVLNRGLRRQLSDAVNRYRDRYTDLWMAYSRETEHAVQSRGMPKERTRVVGNAMLGREEAALLRDLSAAAIPEVGGRIRVAFIGTMRPAKRIPFLIQALPKLKESCRDLELCIVGDGPDLALIKAWAQSEPWVRTLGRQEGARKAEILARSDFLISPGNAGLVATEAQVAGVPVITSASSLQTPEFNFLTDDLRVVVDDGGDPSIFGVRAGRWMVENLDRVRNIRPLLVAERAGSGHIDTVEDVARRMVEALAEAERLPPRGDPRQAIA